MPTFRNTLFHLDRHVGMKYEVLHTYLPMKMEQCSETSAYNIQTQGNYPSGSIQQVAVSVWHMPLAVCTVVNSWWWTERPSKTCKIYSKMKQIWNTGASGWIYYRNILRCTALWTSKLLIIEFHLTFKKKTDTPHTKENRPETVQQPVPNAT